MQADRQSGSISLGKFILLGVSKNGLLNYYNDKSIIKNRIKRLHEAGKIRMINRKFLFSGRNFLLIAQVFLIAKRVMFRRSSEFEDC